MLSFTLNSDLKIPRGTKLKNLLQFAPGNGSSIFKKVQVFPKLSLSMRIKPKNNSYEWKRLLCKINIQKYDGNSPKIALSCLMLENRDALVVPPLLYMKREKFAN